MLVVRNASASAVATHLEWPRGSQHYLMPTGHLHAPGHRPIAHLHARHGRAAFRRALAACVAARYKAALAGRIRFLDCLGAVP